MVCSSSYRETYTEHHCKKRTQPQIAAFVSEGGEDYLIVCEIGVYVNAQACKLHCLRHLLCTTAITWTIQCIFDFLQDYVLGYPDFGKKSETYLAIVSDIKRDL